MKSMSIAVAIGAFTLMAGAATAEPYVDWTPQKGLWHATWVKVDPSHIDDYLVGLKKTWVPGEELAKKHGLIDNYAVQVKMNALDGKANVLLLEHFVNTAALDPDKDRDQTMEKEAFAMMPKDKMDAQVKDYDKYRTFVGDEYWGDITFNK